MASADFWAICPNSGSLLRANPDVNALNSAFIQLSDKRKHFCSAGLSELLDLASSPAVWRLGSLLRASPMSDDGFAYFSRWLVLQGSGTFDLLLSNPDGVVNLQGFSDVLGQDLSVESLGVIEEYLERKPWSELGWSSVSEETSVDRLRADLPELWRIQGELLLSNLDQPQLAASEGYVDGFGMVKVGDRFRHGAGLGVGCVVELMADDPASVKIKFGTGVKAMRLVPGRFVRED